MDCATVSIDIDDYCTELSRTTPTAHKEHKCHECYRKIQVGETYERATMAFDGTVTTNKTCCDCVSIREAFFSDGYYFERIMEDFEEHVSECREDIAEEQISKLTPRAKGIVADMMERYLEEGE